MAPSWLEAHASHIDRLRSSTTEQLTFNSDLWDNAALLKVPIISAGILEDSTLVTLKIGVSTDEDIAEKEDSDPAYGVSDGVSFLGFMAVDKQNYANGDAPCFGMEGMSGDSLTGSRLISRFSGPNDSFYPNQFIIMLKLNEQWGSC